MRDRKFKAWDKVKKEWVTSFSISSWGEVIGIPNAKDCVLVEWTGLKDKHGKEIWEGDVITCYAIQRESYDVIDKSEKVIVEYRNGYFYPFGYNAGWRSEVSDIEVIGNIYAQVEQNARREERENLYRKLLLWDKKEILPEKEV